MMYYENKWIDGYCWFRTTPKGTFQMHTLKWHLDYACEVIDNVMQGLYEDEISNTKLTHAIEVISKVSDWLYD